MGRVIPIVLVVGLLAGCYYHGGPVGYLEAQLDIAGGNPQCKLFGLAQGGEEEFAAVLQERFGIRAYWAGCSLTGTGARRWDAYNSAIRRWGKKRFGCDVFEVASNESRP
jgi:hypothetical protein